MEYSVDLINGFNLGAEYIPASLEAGIEYPCFVLDLMIVRIIVEFTGE